MSLKNCTRKGCKDVFRAFWVESATYDGEWEIPRMKPEEAEPERLIPFSKSIRHSDSRAWVHFFEDDASIERLWNRPRLYLPILKRYAGVISPDFSLYRDMPLVMQANNIYRGRALGHWLQENGVHVLPNIRFGDERTYGFCCAGIEPGGTIAVGSHGCIKGRADRRYFKQGLSAVGDYVIRMENPGRVPGSKAVYYKIIDSEGKTVRVYKETYDPSGRLVHTKEK